MKENLKLVSVEDGSIDIEESNYVLGKTLLCALKMVV